jgi:hypothetical protein
MSTPSRPATPDQVRLLIGLSSLMVLPLLAIVMVYFTGHQASSDHAPSWLAFAVGLAVGLTQGLILVRFVPVFGGTVPRQSSVRGALAFTPIVALALVVVIGRLVHQAVPLTTGFIGGVDAVLATVLLLRSLRSLSGTTTQPR